MGRPSVLIVGLSTRALAEAAHAAGWECFSIDAFGDLDQKARASNLGLSRDLGRSWSATAAVAAGRQFPAEAAAYVGNLENHPSVVALLARGRELLGNRPEALRLARDLRELQRVVRRAGGRVPRTFAPGEALPRRGPLLGKPLRGGGGWSVRLLEPGAPRRPSEVVQERIPGAPGSVSFLADGRRACVLGVARGMAGDHTFGASGYRYCGSLYPFTVTGRVRSRLDEMAAAVTGAFALRGLNGLDFVLRDEEPVFLELNPRPSASMELIERAGTPLWALHVAACRGSLPARGPAPPPTVYGKAVLWARRDLVVGDTRPWLERDDRRDLPFPGERIRRGHPVCTVFATAPDLDRCHAALGAAAASVEREIGVPAEPVPA